MTPTELRALADRVEALTGPDRGIDRLIVPLVGIRVVEEGHPLGRCYYDKNGHGVPLPLFTASFDAALTLVPAPRKVAITPNGDDDGYQAWVWRLDSSADWRPGSTMALALTAAALRAHAAMMEE